MAWFIFLSSHSRLWVIQVIYQTSWFIIFPFGAKFQAFVAKKYPAVTVIVFFQLLSSTMQCGVFALIAVRDPTQWKLNLDIGLIGILYQVANENQPD